jgi:hypothetical protein
MNIPPFTDFISFLIVTSFQETSYPPYSQKREDVQNKPNSKTCYVPMDAPLLRNSVL